MTDHSEVRRLPPLLQPRQCQLVGSMREQLIGSSILLLPGYWFSSVVYWIFGVMNYATCSIQWHLPNMSRHQDPSTCWLWGVLIEKKMVTMLKSRSNFFYGIPFCACRQCQWNSDKLAQRPNSKFHYVWRFWFWLSLDRCDDSIWPRQTYLNFLPRSLNFLGPTIFCVCGAPIQGSETT